MYLMTADRTGAAADAPMVVFGDDWRRFVSTIQHLFAHIITRRRVIWVNSLGHRAPQLSLYDLRRAASKLRAMAVGYPTVDDGRPKPVRIIEPRALPWHNLAGVRAFNTWSMRRAILAALAEVAPGEAPVLVTGTPAAEGLVGTIGEQASIYFCMDNYAELPGVDRAIVAPIEERLLSKVDATVATAAALTTLKKPRAGRAYHLPQGVNYDHFAAKRPIPPDLAALPSPRIGFSGTMSPACDLDIFRALSEAFPQGSIVAVGPVHHVGGELPTLPNFHALGRKDYADLPAYVQHFDVGIVPYILSDWTRSVDPLKLLEYMATGIPVVSTDIPEAHKYAEVISLADGTAPFVEAVRKELAQAADPAGRARRQQVAHTNRWERRADRLLEIIDEVLASKGASPAVQRA